MPHLRDCTPGKDTKAPASQVRTVAAQMKPGAEPRLVEIPDVDSVFASGEPAAVQPATAAAIASPFLEFVNALHSGNMAACKLPTANPPGQPAVQLSDTAAAGIAAQIAILDEDDSMVYDVEPFGSVADATANGQQQQVAAQQLLQQHAQLQLQQALQQAAAQQQALLAKTGMTLQQAAAVQQAAAAQRAGPAAAAATGALQQSFGIQLGKLHAGLSAAGMAAAAAAGGAAGPPGSGAVVAPVMLGPGIIAGGLTPQMLAAAQAMAAAAAKQGIRPGGGAQMVVPAGAAVTVQQQQQQAATATAAGEK